MFCNRHSLILPSFLSLVLSLHSSCKTSISCIRGFTVLDLGFLFVCLFTCFVFVFEFRQKQRQRGRVGGKKETDHSTCSKVLRMQLGSVHDKAYTLSGELSFRFFLFLLGYYYYYYYYFLQGSKGDRISKEDRIMKR